MNNSLIFPNIPSPTYFYQTQPTTIMADTFIIQILLLNLQSAIYCNMYHTIFLLNFNCTFGLSTFKSYYSLTLVNVITNNNKTS